MMWYPHKGFKRVAYLWRVLRLERQLREAVKNARSCVEGCRHDLHNCKGVQEMFPVLPHWLELVPQHFCTAMHSFIRDAKVLSSGRFLAPARTLDRDNSDAAAVLPYEASGHDMTRMRWTEWQVISIDSLMSSCPSWSYITGAHWVTR